VGVTCTNCGASLTGKYCRECGQQAIDPDPTLREFLHEAAEHLLQWDGKLLATFRTLVTKPGNLTTEYLAGRRVSYLSPLKLYLLCSVLYFTLSALIPANIRTSTGTVVRTSGGLIQVGRDTMASAADLDTLRTHGFWGEHLANAFGRRGELQQAVTNAIPKAMFVLVPLFAGLVALVQRSRRRRYPQHLAFALHVHAFIFLVLTVALVGRLTTVTAVQALVALLWFAAIATHFLVALRRVYGGSRAGTIARVSMIAGSYLVAFVAAMLATFGLIVALQF
jgi:hypothetical protein